MPTPSLGFVPRPLLSFASFAAALTLTWSSPLSAQGDGAAMLVVALPDGSCSIDGAPAAPSPVLARPSPGAHSVVCARDVSGVVFRREATITMAPGKPLKVLLDLRGGS